MSTTTEEAKANLGLAFGLVIAAGLSTTIGAAVVFFSSIMVRANKQVLAISLGFSAGVMLYVSMIEIFQKSVGSFGDAGFKDGHAFSLATLCFFAGIVLVWLLDKLTHCIDEKYGGGDHH